MPHQDTPPSCSGDLCLADPASRDSQYMLAKYGLHQITQGGSTKAFPQIEGDLVIWQLAFGNVSGWGSAILGYDIKTSSLISIGFGPLVLHSEAFLAQQRVLWTDQAVDKDFHPTGNGQLMLWNAATRLTRRIETGLSGSSDSFAFDGTWAIFGHRGSPKLSEDALWAINVDTGQKDRLYLPYPNQTRPDGILELPGSMVAAGGSAYYTIDVVTRRPDQPNNDRVTHLYKVDLALNQTTELYAGPMGITRMAVDGTTLELEGGSASDYAKMYVMDLSTRQISPLPCVLACTYMAFPSIKNSWTLYSAAVDPQGAFLSVFGRNLQTNATVQFHAEKQEATFEAAATDGKRIVLAAQTYPGHGVDVVGGTSAQVYWADLPS